MKEQKIVEGQEKVDEKVVEQRKWKFNIAAFLMPQFWSLGNHVWVGILSFIPILYPFLAIYLGIAGTQLAYEKSSAWNYEDFEKSQRKWAVVSVIYFISVGFMLYSTMGEGVKTYIDNKTELNHLIKKYDKVEADLEKKINVLLASDPVQELFDDETRSVHKALRFINTGLWNLKNDYDYYDLSRYKLTFDEPNIRSAMITYNLSEEEKLLIEFSFDEEYNIIKLNYAYVDDEYKFTMEDYLDSKEIEEILQENK